MLQLTQACFRALADPTRRDIIRLLSSNEMTIGEITDQFDMTRAAVKKHLTVLSDGGLIEIERVGRSRINRLRPGGLQPAIDWLTTLDAFWDERLSNLKSEIEGRRND